MAALALVGSIQNVSGSVTGFNVQLWTMTVTNPEADVLAANALLNLDPTLFKDGDLAAISYGYNSTEPFKKAGDTGLYKISFSYDGSGNPTQTVKEYSTDTEISLERGFVLVGNEDGVAAPQDMSAQGAVLIGNGSDAVPILTSHTIFEAGVHTFAGGSTSSSQAVPGMSATDVVIATLKASTNFAIIKAVAAADQINFSYSTDPGAGTVVSYTVLFPAPTAS